MHSYMSGIYVLACIQGIYVYMHVPYTHTARRMEACVSLG